MRICFFGEILGIAQIGQLGAPFPTEFFFRLEGYSNQGNAYIAVIFILYLVLSWHL